MATAAAVRAAPPANDEHAPEWYRHFRYEEEHDRGLDGSEDLASPGANREYFEHGVEDMALAEAQFPGWLARLLTHPVPGLDHYRDMMDALTSGTDVIKVFCEVAPLPPMHYPGPR